MVSMAGEKSMPMILVRDWEGAGVWVKWRRSLSVLRPVPQPRSRMWRGLSEEEEEEIEGLGLGIWERKVGRKAASSMSSMAWSMLPSESYWEAHWLYASCVGMWWIGTWGRGWTVDVFA